MGLRQHQPYHHTLLLQHSRIKIYSIIVVGGHKNGVEGNVVGGSQKPGEEEGNVDDPPDATAAKGKELRDAEARVAEVEAIGTEEASKHRQQDGGGVVQRVERTLLPTQVVCVLFVVNVAVEDARSVSSHSVGKRWAIFEATNVGRPRVGRARDNRETKRRGPATHDPAMHRRSHHTPNTTIITGSQNR